MRKISEITENDFNNIMETRVIEKLMNRVSPYADIPVNSASEAFEHMIAISKNSSFFFHLEVSESFDEMNLTYYKLTPQFINNNKHLLRELILVDKYNEEELNKMITTFDENDEYTEEMWINCLAHRGKIYADEQFFFRSLWYRELFVNGNNIINNNSYKWLGILNNVNLYNRTAYKLCIRALNDFEINNCRIKSLEIAVYRGNQYIKYSSIDGMIIKIKNSNYNKIRLKGNKIKSLIVDITEVELQYNMYEPVEIKLEDGDIENITIRYKESQSSVIYNIIRFYNNARKVHLEKVGIE